MGYNVQMESTKRAALTQEFGTVADPTITDEEF